MSAIAPVAEKATTAAATSIAGREFVVRLEGNRRRKEKTDMREFQRSGLATPCLVGGVACGCTLARSYVPIVCPPLPEKQAKCTTICVKIAQC
jgi:hypothetical protein